MSLIGEKKGGVDKISFQNRCTYLVNHKKLKPILKLISGDERTPQVASKIKLMDLKN